MTSELVVGPLTAESGKKARGSVRVDLGVTTVDVPIALINGARPGPRVVITAGVHGGEFTGVDAVTQLAESLGPEEVRGQVVLCPVANPPAVFQGRLGTSPLDGVNINRVFPGRVDGGPTERLAAWLFENVVAGADAYVDLHAGRIDEFLRDFIGYRLSGDAALDAKSREMAYEFGFTDVIYGPNPDGGNSHAAAVRRGIPAILVEKGHLGQRDPDSAREVIDGLSRLLRLLGVLEKAPDLPEPREPLREWVWAGAVAAEVAGLWYPRFTPGSEVAEGQIIGHIVDPADGTRHLVHAPAGGQVFYGMHGLTVVPGTDLAAIAAPAPRAH